MTGAFTPNPGAVVLFSEAAGKENESETARWSR